MLRTNWVAFCVLLLFWIVITESLKWDNLMVGTAICLLVMWFNRDISVKGTDFPRITLRRLRILLLHFMRMIGEVVKANIQVVKIVLSPTVKYYPGLVIFTPKIRYDWNKVIFANSISLTPGTFTLDIDENIFVVHLLDMKNAHSLVSWYIQHNLRLLEEEE